MCQQLDFDGIRYDMTFWPNVCYCTYCQKRYAAEVGGELPKIIQWQDPHWVSFHVKERNGCWISHTCSHKRFIASNPRPRSNTRLRHTPRAGGWGSPMVSPSNAISCRETSMAMPCKVPLCGSYFTTSVKINLMDLKTSVMVSLRNHTAKKSKDLLRTKAYACLADAGAFCLH